jgi:sarcosine oxidase subunit delta
MLVTCPSCGRRPYTEFSFGGELRDVDAPDVAADFARVYLHDNRAAPQRERWYHLPAVAGITVTRDIGTNRIEARDAVVAGSRPPYRRRRRRYGRVGRVPRRGAHVQQVAVARRRGLYCGPATARTVS